MSTWLYLSPSIRLSSLKSGASPAPKYQTPGWHLQTKPLGHFHSQTSPYNLRLQNGSCGPNIQACPRVRWAPVSPRVVPTNLGSSPMPGSKQASNGPTIQKTQVQTYPSRLQHQTGPSIPMVPGPTTALGRFSMASASDQNPHNLASRQETTDPGTQTWDKCLPKNQTGPSLESTGAFLKPVQTQVQELLSTRPASMDAGFRLRNRLQVHLHRHRLQPQYQEPSWQAHSSGPQYQVCPHKPRIQAHPSGPKSQTSLNELKFPDNPCGPWCQVCPPAAQGNKPVKLRTHALSLLMNLFRWSTQNLCMVWLVKGFPCRNQSMKTEIGAYFFKSINKMESHNDHKQSGYNLKKQKHV